MWAAGNKAPYLHPKRYAPSSSSSSSQLPQTMQKPWGAAGIELLTACPPVPHAVGDGTKDVHGVCWEISQFSGETEGGTTEGRGLGGSPSLPSCVIGEPCEGWRGQGETGRQAGGLKLQNFS